MSVCQCVCVCVCQCVCVPVCECVRRVSRVCVCQYCAVSPSFFSSSRRGRVVLCLMPVTEGVAWTPWGMLSTQWNDFDLCVAAF